MDNELVPRAWGIVAVLALSALLPGIVRADEQLTRACEAGHARSCFRLAVQALHAGDEAQAAARYHQACYAGHARSCYNLATFYARGRAVPRDPERAAELYRHACDGGHKRACQQVGSAPAAREPSEESPAIRRLKRACNAPDERACDRLGKLVARSKPRR